MEAYKQKASQSSQLKLLIASGLPIWPFPRKSFALKAFEAYSCLTGRQYLETKDLTGLSKLQPVSKERDLLIQISNGLLRPLMVDLRGILGLSPPAGILSLPLDLADKILGKLSVRSFEDAGWCISTF